MRHLRTWAAALVLAAFALSPAACFAQSSYAKVQTPWYQQGKISGGISVTASNLATALPAAGFTAWICNTGSNDAFLAFGTDNTVVASATTSTWLKASQCGNYDLNPVTVKYTYVAAITASSTTTLTVETGLGIGPAQLGGGGGGGGAVTNAGVFAVQPGPSTSGGLSVYFVQPAASDNHANIKNGAGQVYKIEAFNNSATVNYLRLYNAGTGFNGCGSATNLVWQGIIPASTSGAGLSSSWDLGLAFATGISICVTSGYPTNDTTSATASAMMVNIGYK